jgi:UrcA family protein
MSKSTVLMGRLIRKTTLGAIGLTTLGAFGAAATAQQPSPHSQDQEVTVAYRVSTQGLDLSQPAGAREFYSRLKHAAEIVCTHGMRVDLKPVADPKVCYEKALGSAVRSANLQLVTQVYLQTHTLQEAAARGIYAQIAMVPTRKTP